MLNSIGNKASKVVRNNKNIVHIDVTIIDIN